MKNIQAFFFIVIIILFALTSCSKNVSYAVGTSNPDYNGRITIKTPKHKKKLNFAGITVTIGATAAGAYLGSQTNLIKFNSSENTVTSNKTLNATAGGLIGFGVASLGNYLIAGQGKVLPVDGLPSAQTWARNFKKDYIPVSYYSPSSIVVIDKKKEGSFEIKNLDDAKDFAKAFPMSHKTNDIVLKGSQIVSRSELPELLATFPMTTQSNYVKLLFIDKSISLSNYIDALQKYKDIKSTPAEDGFNRIQSMDDIALFTHNFKNQYSESELEKQAFSYVKDYKTTKYFNERFVNSSYQAESLKKVIQICSRSELKTLLGVYPNTSSTTELKKHIVAKSKNLEELTESLRNYNVSELNMSSYFNIDNNYDCQRLIKEIEANKSLFAKYEDTRYLVDEIKETFLKKKYAAAGSSDSEQRRFMTLIASNSWSKPNDGAFIKKAENQIYLNNKTAIDRANEVDGVSKYVSVESNTLEVVKGDDLGFWQSIFSVTKDTRNVNAFVYGRIKNNGKKPKNVKLNISININENSTISFLLITSKSSNTVKKTSEFYVHLEP